MSTPTAERTVAAGQSQRNDAMYSLSAGLSCAFAPHCSGSLGCENDVDRNERGNLSVSVYAGYRTSTTSSARWASNTNSKSNSEALPDFYDKYQNYL